MSELRQNILTGQWVVVAPARSARPGDFARACGSSVDPDDPGDCPFCPGHEVMTPLEVLAVRPADTGPNTPGWKVRVVPNQYPAFEPDDGTPAPDSMFPRRPANGSHEVIIHTPSHDLSLATMSNEDVELVLRVYRSRYRAHAEDPGIRSVHIIVNHGRESGASLLHSHSQLFALPLVHPQLQQELAGASWFHTRNSQCVVCRIMEEELSARERVIAETDDFVALVPFASRFPFEVWIIPRVHRESFDMIGEDELAGLASVLRDTLGRYRDRFDDPSYNCYIHSAPCDGSDYPYYHWHVEALPRFTSPGAFEMGTSMWINVSSPESSAAYLSGGQDEQPEVD